MEIGSKIKRRRVLCGLTQEELANRCELTKGYISQLENDLTEPSITTLEYIIKALGTTFKEFFSEEEEEQIVFKEDDYFEKETEDFKIEWLVDNAQKNEMEPILLKLNPGKQTDFDMPHEGQEFGYVIHGSVTLVYGTKTYKVNKGETFYFTTDKNHYLKNTENEIAEVIWVTSPPNF